MNHDSIFSRGFYLSKERRSDDVLKDWACAFVGGYVFQFHPKTSYYITQSTFGDKSIIIIGLPVDLENINARGQEVTNKCSHILETSGFECAQRYVAYLGGRYLAFFISHNENICIIPDCHATYSCYYTEKNGGSFSSHVNLLGKIENLNVNETARSIVNSPQYISPGGKYYPALLLPYENATTLLPNCRLENSLESSRIINKRFYPFSDIDLAPHLSKKELIFNFKQLLSLNIKGIVGDRDFYISLTGGMDSGVTLSSVINEGLNRNAKAFTYFNASAINTESVKDIMSASDRAFSNNIPYKVVNLKPLT